jgi:hypothetical protein
VVKHDTPGVLPLAEFATIEDVLAGLRERGGRATHARRLLLSALFRDRTHRSAEELAQAVHAQAPAVNISTIYRNLDELVRLGVSAALRLRRHARRTPGHTAGAAQISTAHSARRPDSHPGRSCGLCTSPDVASVSAARRGTGPRK